MEASFMKWPENEVGSLCQVDAYMFQEPEMEASLMKYPENEVSSLCQVGEMQGDGISPIPTIRTDLHPCLKSLGM